MDFDFDARAPGDFPRLDNVFRDDADKLHSDLVGISMDKASAASGDAAGATGEADFGLFSLQLEEDPRRSNRKKNEEEGSSKKQEDNFVLSAIFCAVEEDNQEGLKKLLTMAAIDVNQTNRHGESAIHVATGFGRLEIIKLLASRGANLAQVDRQGDSGVVWATRQGHVDVVKYLVAQGVHLNMQNKSGESCLHVACKYGQCDVVSFLTTIHINLDLQDENLDTPLHTACWHGFSKIASILLEAGANRSAQNEDGESPLHVSCSRGHVSCAQVLLDTRCDLDLQDRWANTALHLAVKRRKTQVAMLLLHAGADFDLLNCSGDSALHLASREGLLSVAQSLCAFGCTVDQPNGEGHLPLHLAARAGHLEVARCLCLAGCRADVKNREGMTPDLAALANGHADVCQLLKRLKKESSCDDYIDQLIPSSAPISKLKLKVFGSSAVGKSSLIETLRAGYFSGLFRRSKRGSSARRQNSLKETKDTKSDPRVKKYPSDAGPKWQQKIRHDPAASAHDDEHALGGYPLSPTSERVGGVSRTVSAAAAADAVHEQGTQGIEVSQCSLGSVGEVSVWEFSGNPSYHFLYDHFIGNVNCVHLLVFSLAEPPPEQQRQVASWLTFLRSRIPPVEPLSDKGRSRRPARILLCATHADAAVSHNSGQVAPCAKSAATGELRSDAADAALKMARRNFGHLFDIHNKVFVLDANVGNSLELKSLRQALKDVKTEIVDGREAKITNVLAENDLILQDAPSDGGGGGGGGGGGVGGDSTYTLVTQRDPEQKGLPRTTRFLDLVLSYLSDWRKSSPQFPVVPWQHFMAHIREQVNPLAADDHLREVIQQLQLMGEVVYLKGELCDLVALDPNWLCRSVCGHLLARASFRPRPTGVYSLEDFQLSAPLWDAMELLPILESLGMCTRCQVESDIEYEFPCFNLLCEPAGMWSADDRRFDDPVYGGILLSVNTSTGVPGPEPSTYFRSSSTTPFSSAGASCGLFGVMFPRLQSCLRRHANRKAAEQDYELWQWAGGSKLSCGTAAEREEQRTEQQQQQQQEQQPVMEALITLKPSLSSSSSSLEEDCVEVKVRGRREDAKRCFFFLEEILGVVDQVLLEMSPGLAVDKQVLSTRDLLTHCDFPRIYGSSEVVRTLMDAEGFAAAKIGGEDSGQSESILDLLCFGSSEISSLLRPGVDLHTSSISTLTRQSLCQLLDPEDPLGKDWCLLAVQLGLTDKVPKLEGAAARGQQSQTAKLLDEWETARDARNTIGNLIRIMEEIGRADAAKVLMAGCPFYRISDLEEGEQMRKEERKEEGEGGKQQQQQHRQRRRQEEATNGEHKAVEQQQQQQQQQQQTLSR